MHPIKIAVLIAEDDENDVILLKRAFQQANKDATVFVVSDGAEAIAYLRGDGRYADRVAYPFPRLLITDLKMPRVNGFELLNWIKEHPECSVIPTVVLSASKLPEDVKKAYQLCANAYFQKPTSFDRLLRVVELAMEFWVTAEVPSTDTAKKCS